MTVGTGLESIGADAFHGASSLTAIILPDNFTTMGASAFEGCTRLSVALLGKSLTSVPAKAFKECVALSEASLPATVQSIGDQAYYNCKGLATISMQEGLKTIGNEVFWNNSGIMNFTIPGTVTSMGTNCFYGCTRVTYLIFKDGEGELKINNSGCRSSKVDALASLSSYTNRYYDYFYDCPIRFLTIGRDITYNYSNSVSMYDLEGTSFKSVTRASAPFVNNTNIISVTVGPKVTYLYHHLLNGCTYMTNVQIADGLQTVYTYAFNDCDGLASISLPYTLSTIDNYAFSKCDFLNEVKFNESSDNTLGINNYSFSNCVKLASIRFPGQLNKLGDYTFEGCSILENVIFNENPAFQPTLTIGNYTFASLENLHNVILPQRLISLGNYTFAYCSGLEGIILPNKLQTMGTYVFRDDISLEYATLSNSCAWLKEGVFYGCNTLKSISIPPIVTKMDTKLFAYCSSLSDVSFEGSSELLEIAYGASQTDYGLFRDCPVETLYLDRWLSYNTDKESRSPFYSIPELKNLTFGENVQVVDKYMFSYCTGLEEVVLPDNITSVGLWGFRGCSSLKNVQFSQKLSQVSDYGFAECTSLDNVIFPSSMTSISIYSFSNCTSLKSLDLGNSLMIIGANSFMNDRALEGINIPETLYGLGVEAFMNCSSLPYVEIKGVTSVGQRAFQGCEGLKWVSLSNKTTSLGEDCFADCPSIGYVKSFADFPPQGLTLFASGVPEEGTLFVPENSIMYYQYDPTWENWANIKPLTDNILVSSITLNKNELSFKASETEQLIATVSTEDATEKGVIWKTSDEKVVIVDERGNVTAVAVGEAIVSAHAIDGSGMKDECYITVIPTLVEDVAIIGSSNTLKKGRTLELTASILPITATNTNVTWTSSDNKIADVNDDGVVTAISAGQVQITATAVDGSTKFGKYDLTIIPPTLGDSNDNDEVTITDAVNTANFAIGNPVENFNQEAADVNGDSRITLADASGTVTIILEQPVETSVALMKAKALMAENNTDFLVMEDFAVKAGQSVSVPVMLDNSVDYVALQADVTVPEGMNIESITIGSRAESNHSLQTKRIDDNTVRIVLFDLNNSEFADNSEPLFNINVISDQVRQGEILIGNILASDAQAHEYSLYSTGGNFSDMTGVHNTFTSDIRIEAAENAINIFNAENYAVAVFAIDGTTISRFVAKANIETINVVPGIYVVSAGDNAVKVIVK